MNLAKTRSQKSVRAAAGFSDLISLSLAEARAISLRSQGLAEKTSPFGSGKSAVLAAIEHLGYIQVDTISVIQRAHHHVLWSRVPDYQPQMLHELQSPDAAVFEYWNHATSYCRQKTTGFPSPSCGSIGANYIGLMNLPNSGQSMRRMLGLIGRNGPLMISDVESKGKIPEWTEESFGKIERRALHELWMRGDIMIRSRKGVQKVFDTGQPRLACEDETGFTHQARIR